MPPRRPAIETVKSLHVTLQKLEQNADPGQDAASVAELKRILLSRIAELEVAIALESADPEVTKTPDPAELVPPASMAEQESPKEGVDATELNKLD